MMTITKLRISAITATVFLLIFVGSVFFFTAILQARDIGMAVIVLGILCIGCSITCLYACMAIAQSLRALVKGAKIIADGNVDYVFEMKGHDEIGQLVQLLDLFQKVSCGLRFKPRIVKKYRLLKEVY